MVVINFLKNFFKKNKVLQVPIYIIGYFFTWLYLKLACNIKHKTIDTSKISLFQLPSIKVYLTTDIKGKEIPATFKENKVFYSINREQNHRIRLTNKTNNYEYKLRGNCNKICVIAYY